MIESFNLITNTTSLKVDLNNELNLYDNNRKELVVEYFNSTTKGVLWICQKETHSILEDGVQITGFPTADLLKMVIIYPSNHLHYGAPKNAFLYDCSGNKLMSLEIPELISKPAIEIAKRTKKDLKSTASFREAFWLTNADGIVCTVVKIDFEWEWWEVRILNSENGEFGECINSGRR